MKNREAVTCNGRPAFYAAMWDDIRECAMNCGWAVALHGSLKSDMDIMAMPWTEDAIRFTDMVDKIVKLFDGNDLTKNFMITYSEKPHNRIVATIPIWADFYLDISAINEKNDQYENIKTYTVPMNTSIYPCGKKSYCGQLYCNECSFFENPVSNYNTTITKR